jgi:hypothetical protein
VLLVLPYSYCCCCFTAGLDKTIKLWDLRKASQPIASFQGHAPSNLSRCKRIHRPAFYRTTAPHSRGNKNDKHSSSFVLTGGEQSHSLSMFELQKQPRQLQQGFSSSLYSRGKLPADCGDTGCIAVDGERVAVSVEHGEILLLRPNVDVVMVI